MSIGTYSELKTAVANWMERADLTDRMPEFIRLAESRIARLIDRPLLDTEATLTTTIGSRYVNLPSDWDTLHHVWIVLATGREDLRFIEPNAMVTSVTASRPYYYTVNQSQIAFERPTDQAYTIQIRSSNSFYLSDASPTNTILTNWPDVYLFMTCAEAAAYLLDTDRETYFRNRGEIAIKEVTQRENRNTTMSQLRTDIAATERRRVFNIYTGL